MKELAKLLIDKNYSISSVESFTVGRFAAEIGSISGISAVYKGSLVSYQTIIKEKVLNIDPLLIDQHGVVSYAIADAMVKKGQHLFDSDICISFTGNAGPNAMEDKPVGLIYIGIQFKDQTQVFEEYLDGSRDEIQSKAIHLGIKYLKNMIK